MAHCHVECQQLLLAQHSHLPSCLGLSIHDAMGMRKSFALHDLLQYFRAICSTCFVAVARRGKDHQVAMVKMQNACRSGQDKGWRVATDQCFDEGNE